MPEIVGWWVEKWGRWGISGPKGMTSVTKRKERVKMKSQVVVKGLNDNALTKEK